MLVSHGQPPAKMDNPGVKLLLNFEIRGQGGVVRLGVGKNIFRLPSAMCVSPRSEGFVSDTLGRTDDAQEACLGDE